MLRNLRDSVWHAGVVVATVSLSAVFLGGVGLIMAREAYRDWRGLDKIKPVKLWEEKKWPDRVNQTLKGDKPPTGLDVM